MSEFFEFFTVLSVVSSALFGAMIGGLYGYEVAPTAPLRLPVRLWLVGLGFIAVLAVVAESSRLPSSAGFAAARAALWTLVCVSIPMGRWVAAKAVARWREWRLP